MLINFYFYFLKKNPTKFRVQNREQIWNNTGITLVGGRKEEEEERNDVTRVVSCISGLHRRSDNRRERAFQLSRNRLSHLRRAYFQARPGHLFHPTQRKVPQISSSISQINSSNRTPIVCSASIAGMLYRESSP